MGGRIGVTRVQGEGTTFHVILPVSRCRRSEVLRSCARATRRACVSSSWTITRRPLRREMLAGWGTFAGAAEVGSPGSGQAHTRGGGGQALRCSRVGQPMPGMDGMRRSRSCERSPCSRRRASVLSLRTLCLVAAPARTRGVDYLRKPVRRADLHDAVREPPSDYGEPNTSRR